ncbi:Magnesium-chelatase subunit ChlI, chloroplastic [Sesamum angolense]|uniref:magnesium chelatase n=1 Tax=Sesamum angolense TaxID=2727404 RepID=A0AAE1WTM8_9LAMI|nr:Magnesium-chelatase subunit ChlI, chloroplastic [Sesamum angolense]
MAGIVGTSSIAGLLASRPFASHSSKNSSFYLPLAPGVSSGRKFYGGIGVPLKKGRSQFSVSISNVATEISPAQEQKPVSPSSTVRIGKEVHLITFLALVDNVQKLAASKESQRPVYPFAAIVGQDEMKLCLLLNVIDPKIGGVMIMGDRGTGKSTTVRSLVDLLPEIKVVAGDPFNSDPEDAEVQGPEVRDKLMKGDELSVVFTKINMVDLPLGNPEEGELRPQLLDRFGMHAQVGTVKDAELRVKIVEERARFDRNPKEFRESYKAEQDKLQQQIGSARSVTNRAARALAALKGRDKVTAEDIATVIPNCLRHRLRKDPLESIDSGLLVIEKFYEVFS